MRIAVLSSFAPSLINFRGHLLASFVRAGHKVIVSAPDATSSIVADLNALGVEFVPIAFDRRGLSPLGDFGYLWKLIRLFRKEAVDISLAYTVKPVIFGSLAARISGLKSSFSLITGLGSAFSGDTFRRRCLSRLVSNLYAGALRKNKSVFFQNPDDMALFIQREMIRADQGVLLNGSGVDLDHFTQSPIRPGPPTYLLIARLLRSKGIFEFFQAADRLKREHPDCKFRLVGPFEEGPDSICREDLSQLLNSGIVEYLGELKDVRAVLRESTVYVLPSYREGTPRTVLEAMATGRPVITTSEPGCRQTVIEGYNGFLVPAKNSDELFKAMLRFAQNPELAPQFGNNSRALASERFDVHKVNQSIMKTLGLWKQ